MSSSSRSLQALGVVLAFVVPLLLGGGAATIWWSGAIESEALREEREAAEALAGARASLIRRLEQLPASEVLEVGRGGDGAVGFPFVESRPEQPLTDEALETVLEIAVVYERIGSAQAASEAFARARELAVITDWPAGAVLSSARLDAASGDVDRALADLSALRERSGDRSLDLVTVDWLAARQSYAIAKADGRSELATQLLGDLLGGRVAMQRGTTSALVQELGQEQSIAGRRLMALDHAIEEEMVDRSGLSEGAFDTGVLVVDASVRVLHEELLKREIGALADEQERWSVVAGLDDAAFATDATWPALSVWPATGDLPSQKLTATVRLLAGAAVVTLILGQLLVWRVVRRELALSRMKTEFVDLVGHELRTPIAALTLKSEMLRDGGVPAAKVEQYQRDVHRSALRLGELVGRILDFARLERGRFPLESKRVPTRRVLAEALRRGREATVLAGQRLQVRAARALPDLDVDAELVTRALRNLIENAARHAGESSSVEVLAQERDGGVEILVRDEGPGLQGADPKVLFEPFRRGSKTGVHGSGLGLAIVERAARVHGGQVKARDRSDRTGAEFSFWLPAAGGAR